MTESNPKPIVVAVGYDAIDAALAFAAAEATRTGCGLHLVHVVHSVHQGPEMAQLERTDLKHAGRQVLEGALEKARDLVADDVTVTCELRSGRVVPTLVEMAADARMIVLEHRSLSSLRRVVTRSVSSGVAAHGRVPVVAVPSGWAPAGEPGTQATVTVGVDLPGRCEQVLRAACAEARARGATLHVLHTWSFPGPYEDIVIARTDDAEWAKRATVEIQAVLDTLDSDAMEGVTVRIEARQHLAADALVEASKSADLLVIGRHDPLVPLGSHLGPVARAVLREAACPVLLADPRHSRRWHRHSRSPDHGARRPA